VFLRAVKKRLASSSFDRFSSTNPVHDLTEAIQTRFDAEGFETEPSPAQSRRVRSLFLLKEHGDRDPGPAVQNVDELFI
jgi:hypothetical protein